MDSFSKYINLVIDTISARVDTDEYKPLRLFDDDTLTYKFVKNNIYYYSANEIMGKTSAFRYGCKYSRDLVRKKGIKPQHYKFAREDKTRGWIFTDGTCKKDEVYLTEEYVSTIPEINKKYTIVDTNGVEVAPEILILDDEQKFCDEEGEPYEIEVRCYDICNPKSHNTYFKVKDVMKAFDIPDLECTLRRHNTKYEEHLHYKSFIIPKQEKFLFPANKKQKTEKVMFLTYFGFLQVLFGSHNGKTKKFSSWATDVLFTIHYGNEEDKEMLADGIRYGAYDASKISYGLSVNSIACIYLFELGCVKDLKHFSEFKFARNMTDTQRVYKIGCTNNLQLRHSQHNGAYKKYVGESGLTLIRYAQVPKDATYAAEKLLKNLSTQYYQECQGHIELITLSRDQLKTVIKSFETLGLTYTKGFNENANYIKELETNKASLEQQNQMLQNQLNAMTQIVLNLTSRQ